MIRTLACTLALAATLPVLSAQAQDAPPQMSPEEAARMAAYQKAGTPGPQHAQKLAHSQVDPSLWQVLDDRDAEGDVEGGVLEG